MEVKLTIREKRQLIDCVKPSNNKNLFYELKEIYKAGCSEDKLSKAIEKDNKTNITNIMDKRKLIKEELIKNEFAYFIILEHLSLLKADEFKMYTLKLDGVLLMKLIEAISMKILQLENPRSSLIKNTETISCLKNILKKIEDNLDAIDFYSIDKVSKENCKPYKYKDICINLLGGRRSDAQY